MSKKLTINWLLKTKILKEPNVYQTQNIGTLDIIKYYEIYNYLILIIHFI